MCTEEQWRDLLSHKHAMTRMLVVEIGERIIGFLLCKEGGPNSIVIDIAFVDSQYRSNGVATLLYKVAIELIGANSIELTFARALKNIDFWQALGFRSLTDTPGCAFTMRALCRLQTTPLLVSSQYVPLQELKIKQYMKTKRLELSTRRTGTFYFV